MTAVGLPGAAVGGAVCGAAARLEDEQNRE